MRRIILFLAASCALLAVSCRSQHAFHYGWSRIATDGSRTGVVMASAERVAQAMGTLSDGVYTAPSGRTFRGGATPVVAAVVLAAQDSMATLKQVIGRSEHGMVKSRPESALSDWAVDVLMAETARLTGRRVDFGVLNFGGIRVDMPAGDILRDDIESMFPFRNRICYLELYGRDIRALLEQMAAGKMQVVGGVRVSVRDGKLRGVTIGGKPLVDGKKYGVCTIDFLLNGGDGLFVAKNAVRLDILDPYIKEVMLPYVQRQTAEGRAVDYQTDGRVLLSAPEGSPAVSHRDTVADWPVSREGRRRLTILHANDTHSHIEPLRGTDQDGMGGVIERAAVIDSVRAADGAKNVLLVHAGDFSQGSSYFTQLHGNIEVDLINAMGYDVVTLGNHEFDNGLEDLARRVREIRCPVVCCNYDFSPFELGRYVKPCTVIRKGGLKIGVIGVLTDIRSVVDRNTADRIPKLDDAAEVQRWTDWLRNKEKCDLVMLLTHIGYDADPALIASVRGVDLVVGGHSHTFLKTMKSVPDADGKPVALVQDGCWGLYLGQIDVFRK